MAYTPVELRHVQLKRGLHGYRKDAVDQLLIDVAQSFEDVWRERADLADKVEELEKDLVHHRERESALNNALVSAEKSAAEARELAQSQADLVVAEAHAEARSIVRTATGDRERLQADAPRIRSLFRSALEIVEEAPEPDAAAPKVGETWPKREDTREFEAPQRPNLYLSKDA